MAQTNSRFITNPSTVEPDGNYTVVLVDATPEQLDNINYFCQVSNLNYDIYLYEGNSGDLQWLNVITDLADHVLISNLSQVTISGVDHQSKFGLNEEYAEPLAYFQKVDDLGNQL